MLNAWNERTAPHPHPQVSVRLMWRKLNWMINIALKNYLQFHVSVTGQCLETKIPMGDGIEKNSFNFAYLFHMFKELIQNYESLQKCLKFHISRQIKDQSFFSKHIVT